MSENSLANYGLEDEFGPEAHKKEDSEKHICATCGQERDCFQDQITKHWFCCSAHQAAGPLTAAVKTELAELKAPNTAPLPKLWQAYGMDTRNNRPAGVYIGCLSGSKELCIEWLEATSPGWREDFEMGRAALRPVTVWAITPEKIASDRATHQERIGKG